MERREEKDERVDFIVFCIIAETESPDWPDLLEEISDFNRPDSRFFCAFAPGLHT